MWTLNLYANIWRMAVNALHVIIALVFIIHALNWKGYELAEVFWTVFLKCPKYFRHFCTPQNFWKPSWCNGYEPASFLSMKHSSEIPTTILFPPCGENCTLVDISSLSTVTRFAGLAVERDGRCETAPLQKSILTDYCRISWQILKKDLSTFFFSKSL